MQPMPTALLLLAWAPWCAAWSCAQPPAVGMGRRAPAPAMGSFDDMLAKTKKRDADRAAAPPTPAPQGSSYARPVCPVEPAWPVFNTSNTPRARAVLSPTASPLRCLARSLTG